MADDDTPKLTDDDLALWEQATEAVSEKQSSKKPKSKTKRQIDTLVDDLAEEFSYTPHDLHKFEQYIDGPESDEDEQETEPQYVETVNIEMLSDELISAKDPTPQNAFNVVEHTADRIVGTRGGVDKRTLKKLAGGQFKPTRRLDLHGHYLLDAYQAIRAFIEESQSQGHKCVLVIHGKGKGARDEHGQEMGIIKKNISQFLSDIPAVLAFHTATPRHGGGGACYVLLRSKHKQK